MKLDRGKLRDEILPVRQLHRHLWVLLILLHNWLTFAQPHFDKAYSLKYPALDKWEQ